MGNSSPHVYRLNSVHQERFGHHVINLDVPSLTGCFFHWATVHSDTNSLPLDLNNEVVKVLC